MLYIWGMKKDQRIQVQFTAKMLEWLKAEAERRSCSLAQLLRDYVTAAMEKKKQ